MATVTSPAPTESAPAPDVPRRIGGRRDSDVLAIGGAAASAAAVTWLLFTHLMPFSGALGWVAVGYLLFLGMYALLVSFDESGQTIVDRVAAVVIQTLAGILLLALGFVISYVLVRGIPAMVHVNLYVTDLSITGPLDPLTQGGVLHGIAGTLIQISIALVITVPLGLLCAVFLAEFPGAYARFVRTICEAMTALPSVVAGLFIYSTFILVLGFPRSGLAAALALSVMSLPIIIRASDVVLRLVPGSLTEASLALGASRWKTVWTVTLPTAKSGLATAVILGTARAIGETSPVLLTAGFTNNLNLDPRHDPMVSLPLLAYELRRIPEDAMIARAFGAASVLLVLVLVLFLTARSIGGRGPGVLTTRQQRRRARRSYDDAARFAARAQAVQGPQAKQAQPESQQQSHHERTPHEQATEGQPYGEKSRYEQTHDERAPREPARQDPAPHRPDAPEVPEGGQR